MNIVLCGMMGCGKTTVSNAISKIYSKERVDTDEVIVERYGEINKIFAEHGEKYFRDLETEVAKFVSENYQNAVISLGGGCVLRDENVEYLKRSGKLIYLYTDEETLVSRLENDTTRPLLKGGVKEKIRSLMETRGDRYKSVADVIVNTKGKTPEEIAKVIMETTL